MKLQLLALSLFLLGFTRVTLPVLGSFLPSPKLLSDSTQDTPGSLQAQPLFDDNQQIYFDGKSI